MTKQKKKDLFKTISSIANIGKNIIDETKVSLDIAKLKNRQDDHKYNIGKIILEKKIKIKDNLINSNIKTINDIMSE